MKTIGYVNEAIRVPNTSVFLKCSENIVMDIYNAGIPDGFTLRDISYQNTASEESLTILWMYENNRKYRIKYYCDYTKGKKSLETRIETDLWSTAADKACEKHLVKYGGHYDGLSDVIDALRTMPSRFNDMLCGVKQVVNEYLMRRVNDDTDFILEFNDFAAGFEPTLKEHGFTMDSVPIRNDMAGGYFIRIYDDKDYDDADNYLNIDTEDMDIAESGGIFEDGIMDNLGSFKFKGLAEMLECIKILFDAAIKNRDMQKALEKKLKRLVEFDR